MKLHSNINIFSDTIKAASQHFNIRLEFVEKDYWITLALNRLSKSEFASDAVFKGGTSLSKGYNLIKRFSEDVDIAIINKDNKSGNKIKRIIRAIEKEMTKELNELYIDGVTSKGSRFRESVFEYVSVDSKNKNNKLIVEINSFANPFPFHPLSIKSMVVVFLTETGNEKYIEQYNLQPFKINVLNKEQTLIEKMVSLIRISYEKDIVESISKKIRHFYDLYFLMTDKECVSYVNSGKFKIQFKKILSHDKKIFNEPKGWQSRLLEESPLLTDFENIWKQLKKSYKNELTELAYIAIPDEKEVANCFIKLLKLIR